MSELAYASVNEPQESLYEVDLDKINKLIKIISFINYFFSFILYPLTEIYIKSGYFSYFNIYKNIIKGLFVKLFYISINNYYYHNISHI